jgi:hypothetical protein
MDANPALATRARAIASKAPRGSLARRSAGCATRCANGPNLARNFLPFARGPRGQRATLRGGRSSDGTRLARGRSVCRICRVACA